MDFEADSYIEDYQIHGLLGDGGQANVYLTSKNGQLFAAKVYHRDLKIELFRS
jgi:hypothetical protein